jgi:Tfp pilus assembly protein PilN
LSDRIDITARKRGRVVDCRRIPLELPNEPTEWAKAVRNLGGKLKEFVAELDVDGACTRVLYRSPTQSVDMASFGLRTAQQACAAAVLLTGESLRYASSAAVVKAVAVGRDVKSAERRWHVIVAADRIDVVRAIAVMIESAGLTLESSTPLDAAIMARLVKRALRFAGPQHGWLHFGDHSSFFILGGRGRVRFERSIGLGIETIVQSLTRPIRTPNEEPINLDSNTARAIFHEHGIPATDAVLSQEHQLTRRHVMPQIQPVLQRYVVELRQSLRFGLPEEERDAIDITVSGPGSTIAGLPELIAWELKLKFSVDAQTTGFDHNTPGTEGSELFEAMENESFLEQLNLQTEEVATRRLSVQLRRWLWLGAAAAIAVVAVDGFQLKVRLTEARKQITAVKKAAAEVQTLTTTQSRIVAAIEAMAEVEQVIATEVGEQADLRATFQELSRVTPASIKLNSMRLTRIGRIIKVQIYGRALQLDAENSRTEVEVFVEALKASPLFEKVNLRNVERSLFEGKVGERFDASFQAILAPDRQEVEIVSGQGRELP